MFFLKDNRSMTLITVLQLLLFDYIIILNLINLDTDNFKNDAKVSNFLVAKYYTIT